MKFGSQIHKELSGYLKIGWLHKLSELQQTLGISIQFRILYIGNLFISNEYLLILEFIIQIFYYYRVYY